MGKEFFEHRKRFGAVEGYAVGGILETGVKLAVIGFVRVRCSQVILNRSNAYPWEVLEILALGDLKGIEYKDMFLMDRWDGA